MGKVRSRGDITIDKIIPVTDPRLVAENKRLKAELEQALNRAVVVETKVVEKPVDRVVERVVDASQELIAKLNDALKENAQLKKFQPAPQTLVKERVVEVPVERVVERVVVKQDYRIAMIAAAVASAIGAFLGHLI